MLELLLNNQPLADQATVVEWQALEFACLPPADSGAATLSLMVGEQLLEPFLRPGDPAWRWRWNPQNATGRFVLRLSLRWPDGRVEEQQDSLVVAPRKLDQERYAVLLADLQRAAYALLYALAGGSVGAALQALPVPAERNPLTEFYSLFDERFAALERAVERIARQPHSRLRSGIERVDTGQARDFTLIGRDWRGEAGEYEISAALPTPLPAEIAQGYSTPSVDTYENRLLKRLLDELWRRARLIVSLAERAARRGGERAAFQNIATRSAEVVARLQSLRALPFLAEVGALTSFHGPTSMLQRDPAYRVVYRYWQDLRRQPLLDLDSPLFYLPIQELPQLYECWCALQVFQALLDLPEVQVREQRLITASESSAFTLALCEETPLLVLAWRDLILRLRYQPRYPGSDWRTGSGQPSNARDPLAALCSLDRHTRIPDLALEIVRPTTSTTSVEVLVLDAKYRLDASGTVPEDALADAYAYLGSIGLHDGTRATQAVLLLYPGHGPAEWYPSQVGALPMLPGSSSVLGAWLERFLA